MNHHEQSQLRCAYCNYRPPAGNLTTISVTGTRTEAACLTCTLEAFAYHARRPDQSASFTPLS